MQLGYHALSVFLIVVVFSSHVFASSNYSSSNESVVTPPPCGGSTGTPCCVNYAGVPDAHWDFMLLPVTLDSLIEKFRIAREVFQWLNTNLPNYSDLRDSDVELNLGRMAEFNRLFLEENLQAFCEASGILYSQLVGDNANV